MTLLSPINQQYILNHAIQNPKEQKQTTIPQEQNTATKPQEQKSPLKKIDKKLACSIGAAIGIIALAGIIIHKVKSGKTGNVAGEGQRTLEAVKQFFDKDNKLTDTVTLQKGRAINADGTAFSGIMKTVNKNGKNIAIEYDNGDIISSTINGKLYKKYENIVETLGDKTTKLTREQGVQITRYDENGKIMSKSLLTNYDNGKLKRFFVDLYPSGSEANIPSVSRATEYTPEGKVAGITEYDPQTHALKNTENC